MKDQERTFSLSDVEDIFRLTDKIENEGLKAQYKKLAKGFVEVSGV